jgi:predicted amidophosphoribosyltransferase
MTTTPYCPRCGAEWELSDPCTECGYVEVERCEACGTPLDKDDTCQECDHDIGRRPGSPEDWTWREPGGRS